MCLKVEYRCISCGVFLSCVYVHMWDLLWLYKMVGIVVTVLMPMHKIYVSMLSTGGKNTTLKYYFTFVQENKHSLGKWFLVK